MFTDHRHPEIGAILATVTLGNRETQMAGFVGEILHFAQQRFPLVPRQPAIFEIGARPFAAVIEEADVVIGLLDRLDLARDEPIEFVEIGDQVGRQCKIQVSSPCARFVVRKTVQDVFSIKVRSSRSSQTIEYGM